VVAVNAVDLSDESYRWWANFILLPAAAITATAVALLNGRSKSRSAAGYALLCAGGLTFAAGAIVMLGAMDRAWALMIILPCLAVVGTLRWSPFDPVGRAVHRTVVSLAGLGVALGLSFLLIQAGAVDPGDIRWWGVFMIAAGAVVAGNGLAVLGDRRGYRLPTTVLLVGFGLGAIMSGLRELFWR
jgi:hypothetical protein